MEQYGERFYRSWTRRGGLHTWRAVVAESDLLITCDTDLRREAMECLLQARRDLEGWIAVQPGFATSMSPVDVPARAPAIAREMSEAAARWGVGPMAAVAGAVAELVARSLLSCSARVAIAENGGDVFAFSPDPVRFGLYAGEESPFSDRFSFEVDSSGGVAVCTSSGKVGHSLSMGRADAAVAISPSGALSDAAATAVANRITCPGDVSRVLSAAHPGSGLSGLIACEGGSIGFFGHFRLSVWGEEDSGCLRRA